MPLSSATRRTLLRQRSVAFWWRDKERIQKSRHISLLLCRTSNTGRKPGLSCCLTNHGLRRRRFFSSSADDNDNNTTANNNNIDEASTKISSSSKEAPSAAAKNIGTIVGAWVFCRHGDRTPSRSLCPTHRQTDEAQFWLTKLPWPSTARAYEEFCASFPPLIEDPTGHFMDTQRNPFGFVTHKGLLQMQNIGRQLRQRYDVNHETTTDDASNNDNNNNQNNNNDDDERFLKQWKVAAYSTNYLRTILSMQSLLDGLLHTRLYVPEQTRDDMDYSGMRPLEWPVPDHDYFMTPTSHDLDSDKENNHEKPLVNDGSNSIDGEPTYRDFISNTHPHHPSDNAHHLGKTKGIPKVFVRIRDQSCDNLNAFDRNPDLMRDLVSDVMQSRSFKQEDGAAAPTAARLANILPGLARKGRKDFSAGTPSGINWVEVADHFVCRTAHGLQLSKFSDFEHDANVEQLLRAMTYKALGHLAWRFRQWYQNPQLLAAIAAPPLREIAQQMADIVGSSSEQGQASLDPNANFLRLYCCHDVTLLALLYALGADFLADCTSAVWREYWPEYASTLVLELVRLDDVSNTSSHHKDANASRHVLRIMINGKVIKSTDFLLSKFEREKMPASSEMEQAPPQPAKPLGQGPYNLLGIQDFWNMITTLESMGEYDFSQWPAMKPESETQLGKHRRKQKKTLVRRETSLNRSLN